MRHQGLCKGRQNFNGLSKWKLCPVVSLCTGRIIEMITLGEAILVMIIFTGGYFTRILDEISRNK